MTVRNPETWRWLTPIFSVLNFTGVLFVGIIGWFLIRTVDQFDHHLNTIDSKFEQQTQINTSVAQQLAFIKGRCCNAGRINGDDL